MAHISLPDHLMKRGKGYAVRFSVPKEYQGVVGKKEIIRGLGTQDLGEAISKRDEVLQEIIGSMRAGEVPHSVFASQPKASTQGATVRDTAHRWLTESDGIKNSTKVRYRQHLEAFEVFSGNIEVTKIDRELALRFINHLQTMRSERTGEPLSHRSVQSYQTCLAAYWRVLDHWGLVDPNMRNPFSSLLRRVAGQKKKADPREKNLRPVTRDEAENLLAYITENDHLKYQMEMYVTVRLLWVTGCRLNEIAGCRLEDIDDRGDHIVLNIREAKTEAGKRLVMIVGDDDVWLIREAIIRAKTIEPCSADNRGLLFPRLQRGGYDRRPSHYLGKALEYARKNLEGDDPAP